MIDLPDARKRHSGAIPRVGGIAIGAGVLIAALLLLPLRPDLVACLVGASVIYLFGIADDRYSLDYRLKFTGQIAAALVFVFGGEIWLTRMPFFTMQVIPDWIGIPLTVVVLVGITNAINLTDGMDGLAGGTSVLAATALGYLAYLGDDRQVALLAIAIIGATLGFLRYNTFPARVFMGDCGSQFLGFNVAAIGILLVERANTAVSPLLPILILALPITDTALVMVRRIASGGSPFRPDRRHLHHQLLDAGLSPYEAILLVYTLQAVMIALAWQLRYASDWMLLAAYLAFAAVLLLLMRYWQVRRTNGRAWIGRLDLVNRLVDYLKARDALSRAGSLSLIGGLSLLFPLAAWSVRGVTEDIGRATLIVLAALLLTKGSLRLPEALISRFAMFVLSITLVVLANRSGLRWGLDTGWLHAMLAVIAIGIALKLRFGGEFRVDGLDLLVVSIMVITPNLPAVRTLGLGAVIVETLLLFYACELAHAERTAQRPLRIAVLGSLLLLVARAFW